MLKEKVATLEDKYASLETELAIKKDDLPAAQSENQKLQAEIVKLKEEIQGLTHDDLPSKKLAKTLALFTSYRNNLSKRALTTSDVNEYHALLDTAESELNLDLSEFRIPRDAIKTEIIHGTHVYSFGQHVAGSDGVRHYIPADVLKRKLDGLLLYLEGKRP